MRKNLIVMMLVLAVVGLTAKAQALMLSLDDGAGNSAVVNDTDGDGIVSFAGALGSTWIYNGSTGISAPLIGSETKPHMDLVSLNVSSLLPGTMTVRLSDSFGALDSSVKGFYTLLGGTTNGEVTFNFYLNDVLQTSYASNGVPNYTDLQSFLYAPVDINTFVIEAIITHGSGPIITSFDAELKPVPEPGTLLLLGGGLIGLVYLRKRNKA